MSAFLKLPFTVKQVSEIILIEFLKC